jgi:hypothetical protein
MIFQYSCKKETKREVTKDINLKDFKLPPIQSNTWSRAVNKANPLDLIGYYHNSGLNYLFEKQILEKTSSKLKRFTSRIPTDGYDSELIYDASMDYIGEEFGIPIQQELVNDIPFTQPDSLDISGQSIMDLSVNINGQIDLLPASSNVKTKTSELLTLLLDTSAIYAGNYELTKDQIMIWENSLINNPLLTEAERNSLLASGSILRYSLFYWLNYDSNLASRASIGGRFNLMRWLGWTLVAAADAIGGYVGFWTAGPIGAVGFGAAGSGLGFLIFRERGWDPW